MGNHFCRQLRHSRIMLGLFFSPGYNSAIITRISHIVPDTFSCLWTMSFCYDFCPLHHRESTYPTLIIVYTRHCPCSVAILTGKDWYKMPHTPDKQDNNTYVRP